MMRWIFAATLFLLGSSIYTQEPSPAILCKCPPPGSYSNDVAWELLGKWLYLQPNGSNLYYAAEAFPYDLSIADPPVSPNWQIFEINPGFHSAFEVGIKCLLLKNDMDIELNWERLDAEDTNSMNVTPLSYGTGNMVGPIYDIGPNSSKYKSAKGKGVFKFDEANLLVGKSICFKELMLSFDLGLSFTRIEQKITSFYSNSGDSTSRNIDSRSSYWGIGPQFGLNLDYCLYYGLHLTGSSSWSLYMGQIENDANYESYAPGLTTVGVAQPNTQENTIPTRSQLIPGFEERLGLTYKHSFKNCNLSLGGGYVFQIYLNAVQSMDMLTQAVPDFDPGDLPPLAVFALTFNRTLSHFMLTGPYASLSLGF